MWARRADGQMDCLTNYLPPAIAPTCPGFFQGVLALRSSMYDNQGACGMVIVCRIGGRQNNGETMKRPCYVGAMAALLELVETGVTLQVRDDGGFDVPTDPHQSQDMLC